MDIITHYGYTDGSGEYYISIDADKCIGCAKCTLECPNSVLELETMLIDLDDKTVVSVTEEHRKKLRYSCSPCNPENSVPPCVKVCDQKAIKTSWKTN
jgi:Fe-S-cluster-containing hydrogenase component 2